jgi:hypothetical protein
MTALWISLAAAVALLITWRLRRAAKVLDRILREERERPSEQATSDEETRAEQSKG